MVIKNKLLYGSLLLGSLLKPVAAGAYELSMNTAQLQAMDKITGRVSVIEAPVNSEIKFGSFSIVVRSCKSTPPEETPENYAFVDVADSDKDGKLYNIFKGWMTSSSPALNAVEHPIYDVWLLKCLNKSVEPAGKLTAVQLSERDKLPKKDNQEKGTSLSKEAIRAAEAAAEAKAAEEDEKLSAEVENSSQDTSAPEAVSEVKEIPAPATAIENSTGEQKFEEGSPVSLIPTTDEEVQADDGPQQLINIPDEAKDTPLSAETQDEHSDVSPKAADVQETSTDEKAPVPFLTEEDILPTVEEAVTGEESRSVVTDVEISEKNGIND